MGNVKNESMVNVAFDVLTENKRMMNFLELFKDVCKRLEFNDEQACDRISNFYTNLTLDGRFVNLGDNEWDLRSNQTYDKVHIDMNDVYTEMEEEAIANTDIEEYDEEEKAAAGFEDSDEDKDEFDSNKEDI